MKTYAYVYVYVYIHTEHSYINTNHPDFIGGSPAVSTVMERMDKQVSVHDVYVYVYV